MRFLGVDLGSSFVKASLLDGESGRCVAAASWPEREMEIRAPQPGWAEQDPDLWWECVKRVTRRLLAEAPASPGAIGGIGIAYQMHGLVLVDEGGRPLRPAILWCDGRSAEIGREAFEALGRERCLRALMNSPGNFTASKARWVLENEPQVFARARKMLLPGEVLAMRMTGRAATTVPGLSEGILWDFEKGSRADFLLDHYGIPGELLPEVVPTFGRQGELTSEAAEELGLAAGTPVTYRAGDQPNNALSLDVLEPGEFAATAGTSGVVYAVTDSAEADPRSRVNTLVHVNHEATSPRLGVLLCINGAGSANRWTRSVTGFPSDEEMDRGAATIACGSDGVRFLPFGNGAERMFEDREIGAQLLHLRFNRHGPGHLARAVQEGIAFAFRYGIDVLAQIGIRPRVLRAGIGNLFRSPVFRETLADVAGVAIELYETDGSLGAARGAAIGAGHYRTFAEAFEILERKAVVEPSKRRAEVANYYDDWLGSLRSALGAGKA